MVFKPTLPSLRVPDELHPMVLEHQGLVGTKVRQYLRKYPWLDREDLQHVGTLGLMRGVLTYTPGRVKPGTYLGHWIFNHLQRYVWDELNSGVKTPRHRGASDRRERHRPAKVLRWTDFMRPDPFSPFEFPPSVEEGLVDRRPEPPVTPDPAEVWSQIASVVPPDGRAYRLLRMRFVEGLSLEAVGREFHISKERVRQIQEKTLRRLRKFLPEPPWE